MKKTTITMDGNGILSIPSNLEDLWMSEGKLVDILYYCCPVKLFKQNKLGLPLLTKSQPFWLSSNPQLSPSTSLLVRTSSHY